MENCNSDINKKYGMLTVLNKINKKDRNGNNRVYWLCKCDCGNEKWIRSDGIKRGFQTSCGCLKEKNWFSRKDVTGQRFGQLTAISCEGVGDDGIALWKCKCDCGNIIVVSKSMLRGNNKKSCGCLLLKSRLDNANKAYESNKENNWVEGTSLLKIKSKKLLKNNKSGIKGVSWDSKREKWIAQITFKGKNHNLGRYDKIENAVKARKEAELKLFKPIIEKYKSE